MTGYYISHSKPLITHIDLYWILWTCYLITVCLGFYFLFSCKARVLFEHCLNHHIRLRANIKSFPFDLFLENTALKGGFKQIITLYSQDISLQEVWWFWFYITDSFTCCTILANKKLNFATNSVIILHRKKYIQIIWTEYK